MGNKKIKGFALLITIVIVVLFSIYSIKMVESNTLQSNINKHKYLHLQANIHLNRIVEFIMNNTTQDIENFTLNDNRYNIDISKIESNGKVKYYISIQTADETHIRLYKIIEK